MKPRKKILDPFMIHEVLPSLIETAFGSHPCRVVSVTTAKQCPFTAVAIRRITIGTAYALPRKTQEEHKANKTYRHFYRQLGDYQ